MTQVVGKVTVGYKAPGTKLEAQGTKHKAQGARHLVIDSASEGIWLFDGDRRCDEMPCASPLCISLVHLSCASQLCSSLVHLTCASHLYISLVHLIILATRHGV